MQKLIQDGDQVRFEIITDGMEFLATKADGRFFAKDDVRPKAVYKPPQERQQRPKHPPPQKRQPSKSTAQNDSPSPCFLCRTSRVAKTAHIWNSTVASANELGISSANVITYAIVAPRPNEVKLCPEC